MANSPNGLKPENMLKAIGQLMNEQREEILEEVDARVESLAASSKAIEDQERNKAFYVADQLNAALGFFLHEPISFQKFGKLPHPLFTPPDQMDSVLAPLDLSTVSPNWLNAFLGSNR